MSEFEIGVCSWSIDRHDVLRSMEVAQTELGLGLIQLGFFTRAAVEAADAGRIREAAERLGVRVAGTFVAFEGEDYSSIEQIARTGGFGDDGAYPARLSLAKSIVRLTRAVGVGSMAVHAGTVASDSSSTAVQRLRDRVREVAEFAGEHNVTLLLETGREPAGRLVEFVAAVDRSNVGVNFDPGNFVVYGTDDPARAVSALKGRIELVHLKDAARSEKPGVAFGRPAPFGQGEAEIARVVSKLRASGYRGPLLLECATPQSGLEPIRHAVEYLRSMFG